MFAALCTLGLLAPSPRGYARPSDPGDISLSAGRLFEVDSGAVSVSGTHELRRSASGAYSVKHGPAPAIPLTAAPRGQHRIKQSGSYSLVGGTVFVAAPRNGARLMLRTGTSDTDLFGPHVVWSTDDGQVRQRYLNPEGPVKKILARSGAAGPVAVWGPRSAYLDTEGRIHILGNLGYERRTVPAGRRVRDLRLNYATLSWTADDGSVHVMDLGEAEPRRYKLALRPPYAVEGRQVAGIDAQGRVRVQNLPFTPGRQAPWLISSQLSTELEAGKPWKPRFDVSKPLTNVRLTLLGSGSALATLQSKAPFGTIGGFRWDGRDHSGRAVPPSCYTWVLQAEAADGSGPVIGDLGPEPGGSLNLTPVGGWPDGLGMGCWSGY
ncbi:hypothetical protein LWF15_03520 [Kineosporia rhizophila]|uniref:hypothetical protein n=1 Tax=Kineosporia rhizophila TaxID=84633 RepID=UPI001E64C4E9|nr:hypothetical protein [Kineosporia rhizophila]MCE0534567.1 hypothetical protein [Kineosporia rhizophila]